ncbi:oligosaccharide flippase family protein [Stenotrophomonas sp. W1S232]|uniref:Oligosaccharide flippase family protein n=1 Tax=Stenotrophomonas koreensis TaxID=266128 RepID=A0A7W3UZ48_9GAMM|nr:oligosaccharide flippase family protein [Stenotrophomonas koreensis]MBB1115962.1 oligosaccharide flippase family protein [Stenotrophomonas koreensis]
MLGSIITLLGGTVGAQIIALGTAPILSRIFRPEDFGILALYASILSVASVIASLRLHLAILLPKTIQGARAVAGLAGIILLAMTALITIITLTSAEYIVYKIGNPSLKQYLWLIPIGFLIVGAYQIVVYFAMRQGDFISISLSKLHQAVTMALIQIGGAQLGTFSLIVGHALGQGAGLGVLIRKSKELFTGKLPPKQILWALHRYKKFPIYTSWAALFNTMGQQLPPIVLGASFGAHIAGIYFLAHRALVMPIAVIGRAVSDAYFSQSNLKSSNISHGKRLERTYQALISISAPPALGLIIIAPIFFKTIFGDEWMEAGDYARVMTPWLLTVFVISPLSTIHITLEKQVHGIFFESILISGRIASLWFGVKYGTPLTTVALFSTWSTICWIGYLIWSYTLTEANLTSLITSTLRAFVAALFFVTPIIIAIYLFQMDSRALIIACIISGFLLALHYWREFRTAWKTSA